MRIRPRRVSLPVPAISPTRSSFCQQAAEKSLKAFLTWHERAFRRTHELEELGEDYRAIDGRPG